MTARRAILHIGTEKTGTTALQAALANNREQLIEQGFVYSAVAGQHSHVLLAAYADDDDVRDDLRRQRKIVSAKDLERFRADFAAALAAEVTANAGHVFLFSSEHCHSRLKTGRSVMRLAALLRSLFDEVTVLVYLRRQDELAISRYSTILKGGGTPRSIIGPDDLVRPYYNYWRLTRRWARAFGEDALVVRRFQPDRLIGGSIIDDYCATIGLPALVGHNERMNESLRPQYQQFLRAMNARMPRLLDGQPHPERRKLTEILYRLGRGRGASLPRAEAEAFYRAFVPGNRKVCERFFPGEASLFDEDFSHYSEVVDPLTLSADEAMDIFAAVWHEVMTRRGKRD